MFIEKEIHWWLNGLKLNNIIFYHPFYHIAWHVCWVCFKWKVLNSNLIPYQTLNTLMIVKIVKIFKIHMNIITILFMCIFWFKSTNKDVAIWNYGFIYLLINKLCMFGNLILIFKFKDFVFFRLCKVH